MRLLHTADWHVNDRLGRIDRTGDIRLAIERIAQLCISEKVDVLMIAGDLFSEMARPDALRETIRHWQEQFSGFLSKGGTILATTGNHDSETFCQTLRHAMSLAAGDIEKPGDTLMPGRFFLATKPTCLKLSNVQFVLMPWPTVSQYPQAVEKSSPIEDRALRLSNAFNQALKAMPVDFKKPAVLIAHIQASGMTLGNGFRIDERDNIAVDAVASARQFHYVALGHVHKPQLIGGLEHIRYSGSIERMDLGEQHDQKGCIIVDLNEKGLAASPRFVPLPATAVYQVIITDQDEDLSKFRKDHPNALNDLVNIFVQKHVNRVVLDSLLGELSSIFPRWYARDWNKNQQINNEPVNGPDHSKSFAEQVREYVQSQLLIEDEETRKELTQRLEALLAEVQQ